MGNLQLKDTLKKLIMPLLGSLLIFHLFAVCTPYLLSAGVVSSEQIISWCVGDATGDGESELLAVSGSGKTHKGEPYGQFLLICDLRAKEELDKRGYITSQNILHRIDLSEIRPMKVQLGDVNGDGVREIAVCVYKTTKFYPDMDKRPFFYDLAQGALIPVWLGSRLSRPFVDYILMDIDADGIDEIVSIERLENGKSVLAAYNWAGFGFEMLTESGEQDGSLSFDTNAGDKVKSGEVQVIQSSENSIISRLTFLLAENDLVCTRIDEE